MRQRRRAQLAQRKAGTRQDNTCKFRTMARQPKHTDALICLLGADVDKVLILHGLQSHRDAGLGQLRHIRYGANRCGAMSEQEQHGTKGRFRQGHGHLRLGLMARPAKAGRRSHKISKSFRTELAGNLEYDIGPLIRKLEMAFPQVFGVDALADKRTGRGFFEATACFRRSPTQLIRDAASSVALALLENHEERQGIEIQIPRTDNRVKVILVSVDCLKPLQQFGPAWRRHCSSLFQISFCACRNVYGPIICRIVVETYLQIPLHIKHKTLFRILQALFCSFDGCMPS